MSPTSTPSPNPQSFLYTPLQPLTSKHNPPLFSGVLRNASRTSHPTRPPLHPLQTYIIRNNSAVFDRGENTIYAPPAIPPISPNSVDFFSTCTPLYKAKVTRDGSILGYMIRDAITESELVKVHFHGDTSSALSRTFKAFIRSPVLKWDVENIGLFADLPHGANLGLIQEVFPDHRIFLPSAAMKGMPRLEMQVAAGLGRRYSLAVTNVPEPLGEVDSDIIGRFAPRSETYTMALRDCTREEALMWLCMVIATDMKRRKSQNTQFERTFLPVYL